jgi:thymidylate synthase ThyX
MLTSYYATIKPREGAEYAIRPGETRKLRWSELATDDERKEFERVYKNDLKTRACDTARVVLPSSTLTNMAMVANGRTYEYLLKTLYSSDMPEFLDIAERLHETLNRVIPQYVKRAKKTGEEFLRDLRARGAQISATYPEMNVVDAGNEVTLIESPNLLSPGEDAQIHLLAAALYPHARASYGKIIENIKASRRNYVGLIGYLAGGRQSRRDRSPRAFELGYPVNAEVVCDFGAFRDLHRHRMLTLERQALTPYLGFAMPDDVVAIGMGNKVAELAHAVSELYANLEKEIGVDAAEYCALFGHNLRFRMGMNLREAQHLLELRSIPQGHPNYRRVVQKICKEIYARAPWLAETGLLKFVDWNEYHWARAGSEAFQSQEALKRSLLECVTGHVNQTCPFLYQY